MTPYLEADGVTLYHGDALDVLRGLPDASVDAVVTDPPYGLEFMGKDWDRFGRGEAASNATAGIMSGGLSATHGRPSYLGGLNPRCLECGRSQRGGSPCRCEKPCFTDERGPRLRAFQRWCEQWAAECLRVLKPGAHLLAFGGTRTYHRLVCAIEDAGFEIRDSAGLLGWVHGQGFPKSKESLKPAWEPIVVARKPLAGTMAVNVLAYGTGALNVDGCRVGTTKDTPASPSGVGSYGGNPNGQTVRHSGMDPNTGRWPTNLVLSHSPLCEACECGIRGPHEVGSDCRIDLECAPGCPVREMDRQSGSVPPSKRSARRDYEDRRDGHLRGIACTEGNEWGYGDSGGASRFFPVFRYEPKAPTHERPRVLRADGTTEAHATVKPLDLMRWLVRLVTPPGGLVLDPFAGSGTTGEACIIEGFRSILVEREPCGQCKGGCLDHVSLIVKRLDKPIQSVLFPTTVQEGPDACPR